MTGQAFATLPLTQQCVVICDLSQAPTATSPTWELLRGSQAEIGQQLAARLEALGLERLDDFGGVCQTFLCCGDAYLETPPRIRGRAAIFSFTPKKRLLAEGLAMARSAQASGYRFLMLTSQKQGKFGKIWVLAGLLRHFQGSSLLYYEDTNTVIDELKALPEGDRVIAVHVQAPGYEDYISQRADRVISQSQYQQEVLGPTS